MSALNDLKEEHGANQRRPIPTFSTRGSRRRLARSSLLAGFKAMTDTWTGGESRA